jgi:tRNA (guanine10-N2)-dimethyltransferase
MQSSASSHFSPGNLNRLFFILSGEHSSLPSAEIEAILDSEQFEFTRAYAGYRLLILEASPEALQPVSQRSLMYDQCGIQLGESRADENEFEKLVRGLPLEKLCAGSESFAVRSVRLGGANRRIRRTTLEKRIGGLLNGQVPRLKVNLTKPDLTFLCVIHENSINFGITTHQRPAGPISLRRPRKRPVFHPATMPPKIARCMVNLAS